MLWCLVQAMLSASMLSTSKLVACAGGMVQHWQPSNSWSEAHHVLPPGAVPVRIPAGEQHRTAQHGTEAACAAVAAATAWMQQHLQQGHNVRLPGDPSVTDEVW